MSLITPMDKLRIAVLSSGWLARLAGTIFRPPRAMCRPLAAWSRLSICCIFSRIDTSMARSSSIRLLRICASRWVPILLPGADSARSVLTTNPGQYVFHTHGDCETREQSAEVFAEHAPFLLRCMMEADEDDGGVDWKKTNVFVHLRRQFSVSLCINRSVST